MRGEPSTAVLALRGAAAIVVAVIVGALLVLRGTGALDRTEAVTVEVPAEVGLITDAAPVRYAGVDVGRVAGIDAGPQNSTVHLDLDRDLIGKVPAGAQVRVVPRTFFGDVFIELVPGRGAGTGESVMLTGGDELVVDTGPEAVALYAVYARVADLLAAMEPEHVAAAIGALAEGLDGRGERLGTMIDDLHAVSREVGPHMVDAVDATGALADTLAAARSAAPAVLDSLAAGADLSDLALDRVDGIRAGVDAAADLSVRLQHLVAGNRTDLTAGFGATARVLQVFGANPSGLTALLTSTGEFGQDAARVFQTGRFDITAVAALADPLPYTYLDCPVYAGLSNPECRSTASSPGDYRPVGLPDTIADALDQERQFPVAPPAADDPAPTTEPGR